MKERFFVFIKKNPSPLIGMLAGVLIGMLLLIKPGTVVNTAVSIAGWALIALGVVRIAQYALRRQAQDTSYMSRAVLLIVAGVITLSISRLLIGVIPFILGFALVASGVFKFQGALDMRRLMLDYWQLGIIMALFSALFGLLILLRPFSMGAAMMRLIGLLLIIESVQDLLAYFRYKTSIR